MRAALLYGQRNRSGGGKHCNAERDNRDNQSPHENGISDAQVMEFRTKDLAEKVQILDHTAVQVIAVFHHLPHSPIEVLKR